MPEFSKAVMSIARLVVSKRTAQEQVGIFQHVLLDLATDSMFAIKDGLLSGQDPTAVNPADPLRLWIVQVGERFPAS